MNIKIICRNSEGQIIDLNNVTIPAEHPIYKVLERINHEKGH